MPNELRKRIESLNLDAKMKKKIEDLICEAEKEFPCLHCPSKDECENFNWFRKWFSF